MGINVSTERPAVIEDSKYRYDSFKDGKVFDGKKKGRLPAMGWNSWNAFGSGNTSALTRAMADKFIELGLDKLGYEYIVLDDGCYKQERVDGKLSNEEVKFPEGFRALADYIHDKGLKFGMYNDIGTNLCAGAAVGTCGHELTDARSYIEWGVDFIKVDNCYYLWDNATFSNAENAQYTYAPNIRGIEVEGNGLALKLSASYGELKGAGAELKDGYVTGIGTFDGTGPQQSPVGDMSAELVFKIEAPADGEYDLQIRYATGKEPGVGSWLQIATGDGADTKIFYDDMAVASESPADFISSQPFKITLSKGENILRLMNHRRQENTLCSYAALLEAFNEVDKEHGILLSICEWGKTQPQNWGYKVGDSWRILNDITFQVGADGNPGRGEWASDYTPGVAVQYNKAVIMDDYAGLDKGWNDPDMLMIGMDGLDISQCRTHFAMWCMMNSPLMLGLDLRRVNKGDELYNIIANADLIALNQDALGVQAKRVYSSLAESEPDKEYIRDNNRADILAKPLSDGSVAVSFINLSDHEWDKELSVDIDTIIRYIGAKMKDADAFKAASSYKIKDLWSGKESTLATKNISVSGIGAFGNITLKISVLEG
ncbi:MAG: glycoside hydrolase family 27 protein [Lachnospiraceae bacterium]|nr:glycoside hydrolase family 27 protein [Lachnospiraceae bacterium]